MILEMKVGWKPWPTYLINSSRIRTPLITHKGENEKKLADGSVKMRDLVNTAASRLMI